MTQALLEEFIKNQKISLFIQNSQQASPGALFFALKGQKFDGHNFLQEVAKKGALGAVVSKEYEGNDHGLILFKVDDVADTLRVMAKNRLKETPQKVVAITGSVGKTTTKDFLFTLLQRSFFVYKNPLSYNSKITLPLCILNAPKKAEFLILEMGMSKEKEILELIEIAPPYLALIVALTYAHSENFPTGLKGIAQAKAEIFSKKETSIKIADFALKKYLPSKDVLFFSLEDKMADFFLDVEKKIFFYRKKSCFLNLPDLPKHLLHDLLAATVVALNLGLDINEIEKNFSKLERSPLRFQIIEKKQILIIQDCYNANPASMLAALESLKTYKNRRKIALLAGMKELGSFSSLCHKEVGRVALHCIDILFCLGKETKIMDQIFQENKKLSFYFEDKTQAVKALRTFLQKDDVLLIKGSRSFELETILDEL